MSDTPHHAVGSKLLAEFFGTFSLVFAGTGAIVFDASSRGVITHVGVSLVFGLVVLAMILALGRVSGAHINPAVTISLMARRRVPVRLGVGYVMVQIAGAMAASGCLLMLVPEDTTRLGATLPQGEAWVSFVLEFVLTMILMVVILGSSSSGAPLVSVAMAAGATVGLEALFAGPISGASMNPARSMAPALISGHTEHLWMYVLAPTMGALAGAGAWSVFEPVSRDR